MLHVQPRRNAAFLLAEVLVALGLFGITASVAIVALTQMNHRACISRCQTGASTVAQNQIDLILSDMPFNPQKNQIPPELTPGTTTNGTASSPTIPIYTDPKTGVVAVYGWMTTTVADISASYAGTNLNIYQATVTVAYRYKSRNYSVTLGTLRAPDI
ncbi:MAG: hypothetical protein QOE70_333 [Chthoniobacter sp.]|jgi:type II secretory pathway pseudopilin PulG|nr:hypothetical protein [Chthoniobacter sp.]